MGSFILIYYLLQLVGAIGAVNFYGDADRFMCCGTGDCDPLDAAKVFDRAILLLSIYHMIEWVKTTFLLTVVCVGINLMHIYYAFFWNTIFGVCVIVYTMIVVFSETGQECAEV